MNLKALTEDNEFEEIDIFENEQTEEVKEEQKENQAEQKSVENSETTNIDLFAELSKPTDKDLEHQQPTAGAPTQNEPLRVPQAELQNHQLTANLTISAISVGMGLVLQFISDDWTEEAEKKYSLSTGRKKELLEPLEMMLANSKKKYNPVVVFVVTVLITYIPMTIGAMRANKTNKLKKLKSVYGVETTAKETNEESEEQTQKAVVINEQHQINKIAERIKSIKSKKGARSKADREFMEQFGL